MAQLDRLLSVMISNRADELVMHEGEPAVLIIASQERPVTKALSAAQIVALLKEIAPTASAAALDGKQPTKFRYLSADSVFAVRAMLQGDALSVRIQVDADAEFQRATGTFARAMVDEEHPSAPVPKLTEAAADPAAARDAMEKLLRMLVEQGGSDLHMRVGEPPILRNSGEMQRVEGQARLDPAAVESLLHSIMPEKNRAEFAETNDTDFAYEITGLARFRANVLRDRKGAAAVFRVIPNTIITADQLGISPEVQNLCYLTKGLVLVTGPTGSGKSTTLSGLIDLVNRSRSDHVITIEDPIEFVHENKNCIMTQRQVGVHTDSFKSALRAALREDPDIILVGELRDLETVAIAIETAETGHLVFGTLHTTTAASTIDRLIDQFPADRQEQVRTMLSESLKGVVSQVLCKKIGGGRVAAREILLVTPAISNLIREGKTFQIPSMMQTSKRIGMITMNDTLMDLVEKKLVEPKEAYMKSVDKASFLASLKAKGFDTGFIDADPMSAPAGAAGGAAGGKAGGVRR
jgi:twitching motility protein PilT